MVYYIDAKKHIKLNRPSEPCRENFNDCFSMFVQVQETCGIYKREGNTTMYSTVENILKMDEHLINLGMATRRELVRASSCHEPCTFTEFTTTGPPITAGSGHGVIVTFNTKEVAALPEVGESTNIV